MGSGAIGIEFASFYRTMGAEVTVVEVMPQILPVEDAEIAALARKRFEKQGIKILTGAKVTGVSKSANSVTATIQDEKGATQSITADRMISAVGVVGNIEGLGLEALSIKTDRGCIVTDGLGKTNIAGIYAIGDVVGPPWLAHKASHEAIICVEHLAAVPGVKPLEPDQIPGCIYAHPQIASVGLSEARAKAAGRNRWMGWRPEVRGTAMNPIDHPHGGGEGRTKGGRHPVSPWGKPTKGYKTRSRKKPSNRFIVKRREK